MFPFSLHSTHSLSSSSPSPIADAPNLQPQKWALHFNTMVIIAAVICAVVCAIGLNSTLQCILQCMQRTMTEPVAWVSARRMNSGLRKKDVVAMPTSVYPSLSSGLGLSCAICLLDFCHGDNIRVLPKCNHGFHVACVDEWLVSHSSCPNCRIHLKADSHINLELSTVMS